jgi:chromosome segregation ATPase
MLTNQSLRENTDVSRKSESFRLEDLQNELAQKEMTIAALQRNYEGISHVYREEKNKVNEWNEKVAAVEKENLVLRSKIQTFESQKQKALADLDKTQDELSKLLKGFEEVRAVKTENITIKLQFEKKRKECDEINSRLETMKTELESLRKIKIDLESVNRKLKSDADVNDKEFRKILKDYEEYKVNNQALEVKHAELLNEFERLKEELGRKNSVGSSAEQQIFALRQKISADRSELEAVKSKNIELLAIIENYKDLITQNAAKLSQNATSHQEKIKSLASEIYDLKIKLSSFESMDYEAQLRGKDEELRAKSKELEKWKNEAKSITDNLNEVLQSSQNRENQNIFKEKAINELLEQKEEEFKKYLSDKDKALLDCKTRIEDLSKKSENLASENKKISEKLSENEQLFTFTKKSLQQAFDENVKLKESLNKLISEVENLRKRLVEEIAAKSKLQHLSENSLNEIKAKSSEAEELLLKNKALSSELEKKHLENESLQKTYEKTNQDLEETIKKLFEIQENLKTLETKSRSLQEEINSLTQDKKQSSLLLKNFENDSEKLHKIISSQSKDLSDQISSSKSLKEVISKLELQINAKEIENNKLQSQLLIEKSNYKNSVEDNNNLVRRIQDMKEERDKVKHLEETLARKGKNLQDREKSLLKSLERVENALNSLETNLACHSCFGPLENAVLSLPCGHLHCGNCKPTDVCKECEGDVRQTVQVSLFDEIYGKIVYKKQALSDMKHLLTLN